MWLARIKKMGCRFIMFVNLFVVWLFVETNILKVYLDGGFER